MKPNMNINIIIIKYLFILIIIFLVYVPKCLSNKTNDIQKWDKTSNEILEKLSMTREYKYFSMERTKHIIDSAYQIAINSKIPDNIISCLIEYANAYQNINELVKTFDYLNQAYKIADSINSLYWEGMVDLKFGEANRAVQNYERANQYLNLSLHLMQEIHSNFGITKSHDRLASSFYELFIHNYDNNQVVARIYEDSLLYHLKQSLLLSQQNNFYSVEISTLHIFAAYYNFCFNTDSTIKYATAGIDIALKNNLQDDLPLLYTDLSNAYKQKKDYATAIKYDEMAWDIVSKSDIKVYIKLIAKNLQNLYEESGNYKKAYDFLKIYTEISQDYYNDKLSNTINLIQNEFAQEKTNLKIENEKKKNLLILLISLPLILLLTLLSLRNYYIKKKLIKSNNELKILNDNILKQKEELDKSNNTKNKFFSIISHDLRNPLSGFMLLLRYINDEFENITIEEIKDFVKALKETSESLYLLLENLLEWSKIQIGTLFAQPIQCNLLDLVKMSINSIENNAKAKDITIINNFKDETLIFADTNMIFTILRNILTNAIKFTNRGGTIEIQLNQDADTAILSIVDSGIGMNEQTLSKLFKLGEKIGTEGTEGEPSTGLGLILCNEFIKMNNGKIEVESKLGKGSTFTVHIPLSKN
jgi:signal transduction histidine kinase